MTVFRWRGGARRGGAKVAAAAVAAVLMVTGLSATAGEPEPRAATAPAAEQAPAPAATQTLASGLSIPWGIAGLPDGTALVTERNTGRVWRVGPGRAASVAYTVTETRPAGEGGLLGIAVGPNYATTKKVFIYYTTDTDNRVAVFRMGSSARPTPIVTGIPKGTIHNGGGLLYKPGRGLFIGTGDAGDRSLPQNKASLGGKVLLVTSTGAIPAGNPWGRVITIGHRNVQDFTLDENKNKVWATELGQDTHDELNHIGRGWNYGWPTCEGPCSVAGMKNPATTWSPAEASPSGITVVKKASGATFYVGALRGQRVWKFSINPTTGAVSGKTSVLNGTYGRIRGVQGRGDGSLWIMTSNGGGTDRVIRISPAP